MDTLELILLVIIAGTALLDLFRSQGKALLAWGLLAVAVFLALPFMPS